MELLDLSKINRCSYFYEPNNKEVIYEIFKNSDYRTKEEQNKLTEEELEKLCRVSEEYFVDIWYYDGLDDGVAQYNADGLLYFLDEFKGLMVIEDTRKFLKPELLCNNGSLMVEDKLTYQQKIEKIKEILSKPHDIDTLNKIEEIVNG